MEHKELLSSAVPPSDTNLIEIDKDNVVIFQRIESLAQPQSPKSSRRSDLTEHLLTAEQVEHLYETNVKSGLTNTEAAKRNVIYGLNELKPAKQKNFVVLFFGHVFRTFNILLSFAGTLCFVLQAFPVSFSVNNYYLGAVLFFVVAFNSSVQTVQEVKTQSVLKSFGKLISQKGLVLRDGFYSLVDSQYLTVGDIVKIKQGDKVPADIRIIHSQGCKVDNSSLTGEAEPLLRKTTSKATNPLEADNLAFFGTLCVQGECIGIVVRIGDKTMIGSIANLSISTKQGKSLLKEEVDRFVFFITCVAVAMGVIFFSIGMALNGNLILNFSFFIGIFVGNIPQGLPATVTFMLTFAANRLIKKNVLVKDIEALDTLGAVTLICSDKTGTMTQNKMTVVNLFKNMNHYHTKDGQDGELYEPKETTDPFLLCLALNTKIEIDGQGNILGDATETGIYKFVHELGDYTDFKNIYDVPFNSVNKYSISINEVNKGYFAFLKGAPERVLRMCNKLKVNDAIIDIPNDFQSVFDDAYARMANKGQRVLALAMKQLTDKVEDDDHVPLVEYVFLGLVGLQDPPKAKVAKAIASCQTAGIRVFMVTGDHPLTAEAIARQVGLLIGETKEQVAKRLNREMEFISESDYDAVVVHGEQLAKLSNKEWDRILNKTQVVFARTSPKQKLEIVARCQAKGHVVAVTGDGVNDAPALKKADLGISMNISGSDVSKEAAKMILMDDDFSSIVEGIAQGRLVFANLKKAILLIMTHTNPENWAFLPYIIFPLPAFSTPLLIIMIDLFIDSVPATLFVNEPEEDDLMLEAPRREIRKQTIIVNDEDAMQLQRIPSFHIEDIKAPKKSLKEKIIGAIWTSKKHPDDDALIDKNLLFQAYTQTGIIICAGGTFAFFLAFYIGATVDGVYYYLTPTELWGTQAYPTDGSTLVRGLTSDAWTVIYGKACASYWLMIAVPQMFNIFIVKSKNKNVIQQGFKRLTRNRSHLLAICWSMGFACFLMYTPALWPIYQSGGPSGYIWIVGIVTGLLLWGFDGIKKKLFQLGYFGGILTRPATKIEGISRVLTR